MRFGNYCPIITFKIFSSFQACLIKLLYTFYSVKPVYQSVRTKITHLFIFREKIIPQTLNSQTLLFSKILVKREKRGREVGGGGWLDAATESRSRTHCHTAQENFYGRWNCSLSSLCWWLYDRIHLPKLTLYN